MSFVDLALGLLAFGLLLVPGWMLACAAGIPYRLLGGFIASVLLFFGVVLTLNTCSIPLDFRHCALSWLGISGLIAWLGRKRIFPGTAQATPSPPYPWREHWPLFVPLVPALGVVVFRATTQPLFGIDTVFRWNFLAQQMLSRGTLGFYPPVTSADYEIYSWPDGIAPVVSSLYFWTYALARAARPALTAPIVVFQFGLAAIAAFALARKLFSARAAAFACALVAASPVVAWATAMGQETGFTAIALAALLFYLPENRGEEPGGSVIFAGLAAGLGALAREYGIAFVGLGLGIIMVRRLSARTLGIFLASVAVSTVPWYARNWLQTGNPLFNLDVHGWFPVNREHAWLSESYQVEFGWGNLPAGATRFVVVSCMAVLLAGTAGAALYFRRAGALLGGIAVVVLLWAVSLGYTAAGFTNAIRVLSPALVLGAVLGGAACARWIPSQRHLGGVSFALLVFAGDAALRALTFPGNVYKIPPAEWLSAGGAVHEYHARPIYREIARVAGGHRILVLGPNALLTLQDARTVPLWSPEVRFLFEPGFTAAETARKLHAAGIDFVLLNRGPANERYLIRSAFFRDPGRTLRPIWADGDMVFHHVETEP